MGRITIEGSLSPSTRLARGERAVVRDDDPRVQNLIRGGFVNVIDAETDTPEPPELPEAVKPPSKGASREDWAEFLGDHTDVVTEGKGRDELVAAYDEWLKTNDAPAEDSPEGE